jgi:hypothetical protein
MFSMWFVPRCYKQGTMLELNQFCMGVWEERASAGGREIDTGGAVNKKRLVNTGFPPWRPGFETRSCGICGGQSSIGAGSLRVLRCPLPILIPPTAPHSSSIIRGWYNRPISGRRTMWNRSHSTPRNLKKKN